MSDGSINVQSWEIWGYANPKGRSRSPLLELYTRSLRNEREEKIGHRTSAACGGRLRLCYTLDEGKESERETTNCPPKRVRSIPCKGRVRLDVNNAAAASVSEMSFSYLYILLTALYACR